VYVTELEVLGGEGQTLRGVTNVGRRPTFYGDEGEVVVETFLLEPSVDGLSLYDQTVEVRLLGFLRPEQRFADAAALVLQIQRDVEAARRAHGL
jgi:riboflavin kinase/FMN adenylyltransferase